MPPIRMPRISAVRGARTRARHWRGGQCRFFALIKMDKPNFSKIFDAFCKQFAKFCKMRQEGREKAMQESLREKEKRAIERLKAFEPDDGYYIAYSGGKDSDCIRILAQVAGVGGGGCLQPDNSGCARNNTVYQVAGGKDKSQLRQGRKARYHVGWCR